MPVTFLEFLEDSDYYLTEAAKGGQGAAANSKGVAFETGLTAALHHEGKHAELHPNDEGMSAEQAYKHHMGKLPSEEQGNIKRAMKPSVEKLRQALHTAHGIDPKSKLTIHWTSKPGQLARSTGHEEDHNNPGDILVQDPKTKKHVAVSLKFGAKPGLRSPGLEDLHKMSGVPMDHDKIEQNRQELVKLGGKHTTGASAKERNDAFREAEKNPKAAKAVAAINKRSLEQRGELASKLAAGFNSNLSDEQKHAVVRRLLNAERTKTPVIKLHHDPKKGETHISDPVAEFENLKPKIRNYRFEHKGMYIDLHAEDHEGNTYHLAKIGIKHNSSPMTHVVGNVTHADGYKKLLAKEVKKPGAATTNDAAAPVPVKKTAAKKVK